MATNEDIEAVRNSPKVFLTPAEVGRLLGWDAQYIRITARRSPKKLPFPVLVHGSRTQIPRDGFLAWWDNHVNKVNEN